PESAKHAGTEEKTSWKRHTESLHGFAQHLVVGIEIEPFVPDAAGIIFTPQGPQHLAQVSGHFGRWKLAVGSFEVFERRLEIAGAVEIPADAILNIGIFGVEVERAVEQRL